MIKEAMDFMETNKRRIFIITFIVSLITFPLVTFYYPITNRLSSNFNVQINNNSNIELKQIAIKGSVDKEDILQFSLAKGEISEYKLVKDKLTENTSYIIQCDVDGRVYESEMISYSEKYECSNIMVLIKNLEDGQIKFVVYKGNSKLKFGDREP